MIMTNEPHVTPRKVILACRKAKAYLPGNHKQLMFLLEVPFLNARIYDYALRCRDLETSELDTFVIEEMVTPIKIISACAKAGNPLPDSFKQLLYLLELPLLNQKIIEFALECRDKYGHEISRFYQDNERGYITRLSLKTA